MGQVYSKERNKGLFNTSGDDGLIIEAELEFTKASFCSKSVVVAFLGRQFLQREVITPQKLGIVFHFCLYFHH